MRRRAATDGTYKERERIWITGCGEKLYCIHSKTECAGRSCVIHNPSDHVMRSFRTHWRDDRFMVERICPHGIGHPDPDDLAYWQEVGRDGAKRGGGLGVHGCCGCCRGGAILTP